jgi:antitoxin ParD1/3/4
MPTRNVNLTSRLHRFIDTRVASGRFSNASEVVREGLRLLEQREQEDKAKLAWLRGAVRQSIDSINRGEGIEFETTGDLVNYVDRVAQEVSAGRRPRRKRA